MKKVKIAMLAGAVAVAGMWSSVLAPAKPMSNSLKPRPAYEFPEVLQTKPLTTVTGRLQMALGSINSHSGKRVAITDIVTDKKMLSFICHNETLYRAKWVQDRTGLSAVTVIGQKYVECGGGTSSFVKLTNNPSNIKCTLKECKKHNLKGLKRKQVGSVTAHCVQLYDDLPSDRFLRFPKLYQGWERYVALINKSYKRAANATTVLGEVKGLKAGGFATSKTYVQSVYQNTIVRTNLLKLQKAIDQGYTITTGNGRYVLLQQ